MVSESSNWNQKYYRLHEPITVLTKGGVPGAVYTYRYIRKPDQHSEVGDVDFVLDQKEFDDLKGSLLGGLKISGVEVLYRPDLNLIKLFDPNMNVLSFVGKKNMEENISGE